MGGTLLGSSRGPQDPAEMVDYLEKLGVGILFTIGGDGTMLRAGHLCGPACVPILGINLGSLGFLTSVKAEENEETDMPPENMILSADTDPEPAEVETPEIAPESVEAAAEPETPEATPESDETPQELPAIEAALEGESEAESDSEDAGEVSDEDIVLALTLTVDDLKAQLKQAHAEIEALRRRLRDRPGPGRLRQMRQRARKNLPHHRGAVWLSALHWRIQPCP